MEKIKELTNRIEEIDKKTKAYLEERDMLVEELWKAKEEAEKEAADGGCAFLMDLLTNDEDAYLYIQKVFKPEERAVGFYSHDEIVLIGKVTGYGPDEYDEDSVKVRFDESKSFIYFEPSKALQTVKERSIKKHTLGGYETGDIVEKLIVSKITKEGARVILNDYLKEYKASARKRLEDKLTIVAEAVKNV